MVSKKLALGATLSFTMTSIAVLATSISSQTTLVKRANAEDVSYSVTFDSENGALLEDAVSARTVDAVTKAGNGEYPLTLEYLKGTSLSNGLVSLSDGGYIALTTKITNISTITVTGSGNGTLSFGATESYGYEDNFAVGTHYAEGANYFRVKAVGNLQITSITVTYGCLTRSYETFSVLGTGGNTTVTNHGFTDSRSQLTEFYDGKLYLTTTAFKSNYPTGLKNVSSNTMNILKYSSDKTSVERIEPSFFNVDLFFGKLYLDFDTSSFDEGDILVLHKGSSFTATVGTTDRYFMLDNDFEIAYRPLVNRLRSDDVEFTYSIEGASTNNPNTINDGLTYLEGDDTSKRWTNYKNPGQEAETGWTFDFTTPISLKTINLYHFFDSASSRIPEAISVTVSNAEGEKTYTVSKTMTSISDFDNCTYITNFGAKNGGNIALINVLPTVIGNVNCSNIKEYYKVSTNAVPKSEFYFHDEVSGVTQVKVNAVAGMKSTTNQTPYCTGYFEIELLGY